SRRRHTRWPRDWSSDVCSSDLSLGMTRLQTLRLIVLPQAMRVIIPPTGNETISMLKTTSLASVVTVKELLYTTELIYSVNFLTRSEERRVGKECRSQWWPEQLK